MDSLVERIQSLKKAKNAIILAHNYTNPEIQDVADMVGDSLGLSKKASKTDADVIVFCGVTFMGETAKILSPNKHVLLPNPEAKCDMAEMCSPEALRAKKAEYPDAVVVGYVNSTGPTKGEMDVCCTSGNAVQVVRSLKEKKILFAPDRNLGRYVAEKNPDKEVILWNGCCPIHDNSTLEEEQALKAAHPNAVSMAHPECKKAILDKMDFIGSTEAMLKQAMASDAKEFIVLTEVGMQHRMEKECPGKRFWFPGSAVCKAMKAMTLEDIVRCLENMDGEIELSDEVIEAAKLPVTRMTEIA